MLKINPEKLKEFNVAAMNESLQIAAMKIVEYVVSLPTVDSVLIRFVDYTQKRLIPIAWAGISTDNVPISSVSNSIITQATNSREENSIDNIQNNIDFQNLIEKFNQMVNELTYDDNRYEFIKIIEELQKLRSQIAIPITILSPFLNNEKILIGVMNIYSTEENNESFLELQYTLEQVIEHAFLYRQYNNLNTLHNIEKKLMSVSSSKNVAQEIVNGLQLIVKDSIPTIFLFNDKRQANPFEFLVKSSENIEEIRLGDFLPRWNPPDYDIGIGETVVKMWRNGEKDIFFVKEDLDSHRAHTRGVRTICCFPLIFRETLVGILFLHFKEKVHFFTYEERETLKKFAALAAITIANHNANPSFEKLCGDNLISYISNYNFVPDTQNPLNNLVLLELKDLMMRLKDSRDIEEIIELITGRFEIIGRKLGIQSRVSEIFSQFQKYERLLLYNIPRYRDHFLHTFFVFTIGYFIINEWNQKNILIFDKNEYPSIDEIIKSWFICSLLHDVAYPLSNVEKWVPIFPKGTLRLDTELVGTFNWSSFLISGNNHKSIDNLVNLFSQKSNNPNINNSDFLKWIHEQLLKNYDHGILGALTILNIQWKNDKHIAEEAALAVALHNYVKNSSLNQLRIKDYPLAFLLSFCDAAEEWGRPSSIIDFNSLDCSMITPIFFKGLFVKRPNDSTSIEDRDNITSLELICDCTSNLESEENLEQNKENIKKRIVDNVKSFKNSWSKGGINHQFALSLFRSFINQEGSISEVEFGDYNIP